MTIFFFILPRKQLLVWLSSKKGHIVPLVANVTKINYSPIGILGSILKDIIRVLGANYDVQMYNGCIDILGNVYLKQIKNINHAFKKNFEYIQVVFQIYITY